MVFKRFLRRNWTCQISFSYWANMLQNLPYKILEHLHGLRDGDEVVVYTQSQSKKLHYTMNLI